MSDEVINVIDNAQAFKERVAESVRASFGMMIPEEDWRCLVDKEVKAFFEEPSKSYAIVEKYTGKPGGFSYDSSVKYLDLEAPGLTPFRVMVWNCLHDLVKPVIHKYFQEHEDWKTSKEATTGQTQLSKMLSKKLDDMAPLLVKAMFAGILEGCKDQMISDLNTRINNGQRLGEFYG